MSHGVLTGLLQAKAEHDEHAVCLLACAECAWQLQPAQTTDAEALQELYCCK